MRGLIHSNRARIAIAMLACTASASVAAREADIFWRNAETGQNVIWQSGLRLAQQVRASVPDANW